MSEKDLPDCGNCGENNWVELVSITNRYDRRTRVYRCRGCREEGRVFDKGESGVVVHSGAMRHKGVVT